MVSQSYQGLFKEFFAATGAFGIELTRVVLDWLLGHCLTASTLSHDTVPFPTGLPGLSRGPRQPSKSWSRLTPLWSNMELLHLKIVSTVHVV